jgi:uncharacterized membrane protein YkvA (DUF1232 family)
MNTDQPGSSGQEDDADRAERLSEENGNGWRWGSFWREVGLLARLARAVAAGEYDLATPKVVALVTGIAYVVSPLDAVPDVLPVLGWTDDVGVVAATTGLLAYEIVEFREWEKTQAP